MRRLGSKPRHCFVIFSFEAFVFGVYFYTMRAVGGTDELQSRTRLNVEIVVSLCDGLEMPEFPFHGIP
ncbi:hypothetical protein V6N12_002835 [Hibiscus sabdariffa]|uniref:Uncharacterized protein n=1 Tax=Hibiscus sabdariffa TaxID=183260 RepID=A0ABR2EDQ1_9ROSI